MSNRAAPAEASDHGSDNRASIVINHEYLAEFIAEIFRHAGCSDAESVRIGASLVGANLAGHDSHGVIRSALYVDLLAGGVQVADQEIEVLIDSGALVLVDGRYGMGQTVGPAAVRLGIERCKELGVAVVALRNAGHLGRIGEYAEMAAAESLVSMHFVNVANSRLVAPFGARSRRMGTNPCAFGAPVAGRQPVIHDFATSVVAEGKAMVALHGGPALPDNALVSGDGAITGDPRVLYSFQEGQRPNSMDGPGALRAMGEHKGSGIAVMCELLAGALTGTGTAGPRSVRFANGMLSVYMDPAYMDAAHLDPANADPASTNRAGTEGGVDEIKEGYDGIAAEYLDWFREAQAIDPASPVKLPGDVERERRQHRIANGITLPAETWESICGGARSAGVPEATIAAASPAH